MATLILPVGHFLGKYFTSATIAPDSYDVRVGEDVHNLTFDEYTVWSITHGFPELVGERRPTRPIVEAQATQLGIDNSPVVFQRLVNSGLIATITLRQHLEEFARSHRAYPLAIGLGNAPDELGRFVLGRAEQPLATVTLEVFHFWSYLPRFTTLESAAKEVAADFSSADNDGAAITAADALRSFVDALPTLLAMNCVYLDEV